jgi:hypothetical protein
MAKAGIAVNVSATPSAIAVYLRLYGKRGARLGARFRVDMLFPWNDKPAAPLRRQQVAS